MRQCDLSTAWVAVVFYHSLCIFSGTVWQTLVTEGGAGSRWCALPYSPPLEGLAISSGAAAQPGSEADREVCLQWGTYRGQGEFGQTCQTAWVSSGSIGAFREFFLKLSLPVWTRWGPLWGSHRGTWSMRLSLLPLHRCEWGCDRDPLPAASWSPGWSP